MRGSRYLTLVSLAALLCAVATQSTCLKGNCADCVAESGCGWCAATRRCLAGNAQGPTGLEPCLISWDFQNCPVCSVATDCRSCQKHDSNCYWCQTQNNGTGGCIAYGTVVGCPVVHSCPCADWETCSECAADSTCKWCDDGGGGGLCASNGGTCPDNTLATHTCPCSANKNCPACKEGNNCAWCDESGSCYNKGDSNGCKFHQLGNVTCAAYCSAAAKDCFTCNELEGCIWCSDTKSCTEEDTATCIRQPQCQDCDRHVYCDPCIDEKGCNWCEQTTGVRRGYCSAQCESGYEATTCLSYCDGLSAGGCSACNSHKGCVWCTDTQYCVDEDRNTGCMVAHTCVKSKSKCGFDGGAFVGGMFLVIGLMVLGGGGYAFYRYRSGQKTNYSALH